MKRKMNGASALQGMKVVAFAHVIAAPMAASFLADFGADVVHVEPPGRGDPSRQMGLEKDGVYLWWKVLGRNKRSVTLDLRRPQGMAVAHRLASWADVVITNFRPGTLERWGISWEILHKINPKLIFNIKDIVEDEVYRHREAIIALNDPDLGQVRMQAALPKMTNYPGKVWRTGPALGQDNDLVYRDWLQMPEMEYEGLKRLGVI